MDEPVGSLTEVARTRTALAPAAVDHLKRLVAAWGVIADLCFSDLLLLAPLADDPEAFVVLAQVRATTSQTLYQEDKVGCLLTAAERPLVAESWATAEVHRGSVAFPDGTRVLVVAVPVRCQGSVVAVLTREALPSTGRRPSPLERTYLDTADDLIRMVATGAYPFPPAPGMPEAEEGPRVGDGIVRLDAQGKVTYASPNAVSAFHRLGVMTIEGCTMSELGLNDSAVRTAFTMVAPVTEELEARDTVVAVGVIPLVENRLPVGALLLVRDVSEVRRKERMLISKDATIREIHHRVKNNLQTIASLLRLQGRRLTSPEAKVALEESVRRIRSIALVHETLSRDTGEVVAFRSIVRPLVAMVEEGLTDPERPIEFVVEGDAGELPADIATPLAVVVTELLQNAVEHGFPSSGGRCPDGTVRVVINREAGRLRLEVHDNGCGIPDDFDFEASTGLGLQIVGVLVKSELGGTIEFRRDGGTAACLDIPLSEPIV